MKTFSIVKLFLFCFLLSATAQKKCSEKELIQYEWICYNKTVDDCRELFFSDTLLLIKSVNNETYEGVVDNTGIVPSDAYTRNWEFNFDVYNDSCNNYLSFSIYYIDLKAAALRRSIAVDSALFNQLKTNPELISDETNHLRPILDALVEQESIQINNNSTPEASFYYIQRIDKQLISTKTLNRRFIINPSGLGEGEWKIDKKKQLLYFKEPNVFMYYVYKIERIDDLRIRLVSHSILLR